MTLGASVAVFFVAGLVYGCTGFGFGLVSIAFLTLLIEPAVLVPLIAVVSAPLSVGLAWSNRSFVEPDLLGPLLLGALGGIPLGTLVLRLVPVVTMERLVGGCVVVLAGLLLLGWRRPLRSRAPASLLTGGLAGVLGAAMAVPGPPVLLFLANQGETKAVFRATLVVFFAATGILTLLAYAVAGLLGRELVPLVAAGMPAALVGTGLGALVARRLSEAVFVRAVLALALASGIGLLGKGIV
jgi:hypothetical protein